MTPAYPTSITFPFVTFSTRRNPVRNTSPRSRNPVGTASRSGVRTRCGRAERQPEHPSEQVDEQRIDRRHGEVEVPGAEERVRDREGEQHGQIHVHQAQRRAQERRHEQHAEPDPDPWSVDGAPELARDAAGHGPLDLRPGPGLQHAPAAVVDDHLRDLLTASAVLARRDIERHLPTPAPAHVRAGVGRAMLGASGAHGGLGGGEASDVHRRAPVPGRRYIGALGQCQGRRLGPGERHRLGRGDAADHEDRGDDRCDPGCAPFHVSSHGLVTGVASNARSVSRETPRHRRRIGEGLARTDAGTRCTATVLGAGPR